MRARIPNLVIPAKGDRRRMARAASVPPQFVELIVVAKTNQETLARPGVLDPVQTRDLTSFANAYDPLADELEATAHFVRASVIAARHRVGSDALATYALAQVLAKRPETADLLPHVADMRRALGRSRKAKSKPAAAEQDKDPSADDADVTQIKPS
jgi:hypothetical protein